MKPYPDMNKESNEHLPSAKFPVPLLVLMETDSTNRHLTQLCDEQGTDIPEFMTVIAERQTAGKGQRGNSWESEDCKNITFSFGHFMEIPSAHSSNSSLMEREMI